MKSTLIRNAMVVTVDPRNRVFQGDVFISDGRIAAFDFLAEADEVIDGTGQVLLPGFVQTHIHLCQTLFRGAADDLPLLEWLQQRVWPMEAAHTPESISASAALGIAELIKGGTTCALTMETVRNTLQVFEVATRSGFRATIGKCLMDTGTGVPAALLEDADSAILESISLVERWHGSSNGRVSVCLAPRFALSCSKALLEKTAELAARRGILVHTHASESRQEVDLVRASTGLANIEFLDSVGLVGPNVVLAHCIWVDESEREILRSRGAKVSHCPSSNLKLGSGIAPVVEMLEQGISVSLGADGAPCNNRLDMFTEMRTAALLQKVRRGPDALPAATALRMATIEGARAIGRGDEIGSIEIGKRADLFLLSLDQLHSLPHPDLVSAVVYSAQPNQVETVLIDGNVIMRDRRLLTLDEDEVKRNAVVEAARLFERAFGTSS